VSWRLTRGLLNFVAAVVVRNCFVGVVMVVVGDVVNADEVGNAGISGAMMDVTI
jgi:ligand-binding sensor protein